MNVLWGSLILGILHIILGLLYVESGEDRVYHGAKVYAEVGWFFICCGMIMAFISIRGLLRGEGKPKKVTDEEIRRAKEKLDRMYLLEHGTLPQPPDAPDKETGSETGGDKKEP